MAEISLLGTEDYADFEALQRTIAEHFKNLGLYEVDPTAKVVIKPNLIMRCGPERTATTHPAVVEAVIRELQKIGAQEITIADSPGGLYTPQILAGVYEATGMKSVAERCGVKLNLDAGSKAVRVEKGELCREFDIINPIADADFVVNVCKLKTHCMTTLSAGIKNLFGCVPGLLKPQLHYRFVDAQQFSSMLVDLSLLVVPQLTVIDAVDAMEGDGPTGGRTKHLGITAAALGENLYALDLIAAHLIGLSPAQVPMLAEAIRRGLCPADWREIQVLGDPVGVLKVDDFLMPATKQLDFTSGLPRPLAAVVKKLAPVIAPKPKIRTGDCIGCGRCAESCPAQTIQMVNHKAQIDLSRCIHCFCCHEMCPAKAIDIKTTAIFRLFSKR